MVLGRGSPLPFLAAPDPVAERCAREAEEDPIQGVGDGGNQQRERHNRQERHGEHGEGHRDRPPKPLHQGEQLGTKPPHTLKPHDREQVCCARPLRVNRGPSRRLARRISRLCAEG